VTVFKNLMPRYEILAEDQLQEIDRGWRRIVSEIGIQFDHPLALDHFAKAGQRIDGDIVHLDPDFVAAQVAGAPSEFTLHGRTGREMHLGGDWMAFAPVSGPPFASRRGVRKEATFADHTDLCKLVQVYDVLDTPASLLCEPNDIALDSRHLYIQRNVLTLTDKPYMGGSISGVATEDSIRMAEIVYGGRDVIEARPVMFVIVNCNSPLRWDERMLEAMMACAAAGQAPMVTPFLLMGAMSPVSIGASLAQQTAEAFAAIALCQLIRPGGPVIMGSFLSNTDMQSGAPGFGGPESAIGLICSGQIARRYGVPWRSGGGGLTSSTTVDAQAGYEAFNTLNSAFLAGASVCMQSCGWLESGLVASFEKFVMDAELVQMLQVQYTPIEIDLAYDAHVEVGHGGHFLGAAHTLERFRNCFFRPTLGSTENWERWNRNGAKDTFARASDLVDTKLSSYEQPPLDDAILAELDEFIARRTRELGD
jgi:trimethylamine--corrinoid protein Co-methyltransferase